MGRTVYETYSWVDVKMRKDKNTIKERGNDGTECEMENDPTQLRTSLVNLYKFGTSYTWVQVFLTAIFMKSRLRSHDRKVFDYNDLWVVKYSWKWRKSENKY